MSVMSEMNTALSEVVSEMIRSVGKENWQYRDLPKMTNDLFNKVITIIGSDNIVWITFTKSQHKGETYQRGQLWISPIGLENLRNWIATSD